MDYSLHSIRVITVRAWREQVYRSFHRDSFPSVALLHLDKHSYQAVMHAHEHLGLDFDDAYQFALAKTIT